MMQQQQFAPSPIVGIPAMGSRDVSSPQQEQKVVTVILDDTKVAQVKLMDEHFAGFSKNEVTQIVSGLLQEAGEKMLNESDCCRDESPDAEVDSNIGSLYDSVQFESSVYTMDTSNEIKVKTSFGQQCKQGTKLYIGYKQAGQVLLKIASELHPLYTH